MATANLGSISTRILNQIGSVPVSISGAEMNAIVYDKVIMIEQFTGLSVGSTAIADRFQPALFNLSMAGVLRAIDSQTGNVTSYSLDSFSISRDFGQNNLTNSFEQKGMDELKRLGRQFKVYKAYG
jgi:hypothetical protein